MVLNNEKYIIKESVELIKKVYRMSEAYTRNYKRTERRKYSVTDE